MRVMEESVSCFEEKNNITLVFSFFSNCSQELKIFNDWLTIIFDNFNI